MKTVEPKPLLRALSFTLRHSETWPENFGPWNFAEGPTCGIGLVYKMWPEAANSIAGIHNLFGVSYEVTLHFFSSGAYGIPPSQVTPEMVADRIDAYLESVDA